MANQEQIIEKIRMYFEEKLMLGPEDCYIISSILAKQYLEDLDQTPIEEEIDEIEDETEEINELEEDIDEDIKKTDIQDEETKGLIKKAKIEIKGGSQDGKTE